VQKECTTQIKENKERMVCSAVAGGHIILKELPFGFAMRRPFDLVWNWVTVL
jgi:hypothetical protein